MKKKTRGHVKRKRSARANAQRKAKHQRARRRVTRGARSTYR